MLRQVTALALCTVVAACSASPETPETAPNATTTPEPEGASVKASAETRRELGVTEWRVEKNGSSFTVTGRDDDGVTAAEVDIEVSTQTDKTGSFTYRVKSPEKATVRYELAESEGDAKAISDDIADAPKAKSALDHMLSDLKSGGSEEATSLTTKSLALQSDNELTKEKDKKLNTGAKEKCLRGFRDSDGKGCNGQVIQTVACVLGVAGCAILAIGSGGLPAGVCAVGAAGCVGSFVSQEEAGCRWKSCPESGGDAKTSSLKLMTELADPR